MARATLINDIRKYLFEEDIISPKDEMTLILLEMTWSQFQQAVKDVKKNGQVLNTKDYNGKDKVVTNPEFKNQMELSKQLLKLINALYLSPKSRSSKKVDSTPKKNPFEEMISSLKDLEKR